MMRNPPGEPFPFLPMAVSHFTGDCPLVGAQSLHQLDISSYGHFIKWTFHQLDILSNGHFIKWTLCQLDTTKKVI
jgi:hypothetical protein